MKGFLKHLFTGSGGPGDEGKEQSLSREASATQAPPAAGPPPPGTVVGDSISLHEGGRLHAKINGRYVTVLRLDGQLSCIDSICFHAGGPLGIGDIEEVNGNKCLVCPWHFYKIDVKSGEKYYQGVTFENGKMVAGEWKSNGYKQRVHHVAEAGGKIYVDLSPESEGRVESDNFGCDASCGERVLNSPPSANRTRVHSVGADGKRQPSGQVLRGQYKA